ncbi:MAG TPA: alpha/beta hydrolase [Candidatus Limnocylindrales bacterium]|nr:alpha/beta hydrolase [Candidatus Limnocylindrales bacterium]
MSLRAFDGGRLFGRLHGRLPARVLALHGWARSGADFDAVLEGLDAVALDLPGFGATPEPPDAWGSARYAAAVARALPEIGERLVVIGHSFGGRVALHLAAADPERVTGLVLTGVPLYRRVGGRTSPLYRVGRALHRVGVLGEGHMERLRQRYGSADYRAASQTMRGVLVKVVNESYDEQLAAVRCPVRLVWGADDEPAPAESARRAAQALGEQAGLRVLPGHGHFLVRSAPGELRAAIDGLLATTEPTGATARG